MELINTLVKWCENNIYYSYSDSGYKSFNNVFTPCLETNIGKLMEWHLEGLIKTIDEWILLCGDNDKQPEDTHPYLTPPSCFWQIPLLAYSFMESFTWQASVSFNSKKNNHHNHRS